MEERVMRLMRKGAITCGEETSTREVAQIMMVNATHYCVVINQQREVVGIISSRSILKAFGAISIAFGRATFLSPTPSPSLLARRSKKPSSSWTGERSNT